MNILITGANGFIGNNLLKLIQDNIIRHKEDKIVLLTSKEVDGYISIIHKDYRFGKVDFYNKGIEKIDIVLHLGAFTPKSASEANDSVRTISNINNTQYLLDHLPNIPSKFIYLSTIDVYGHTYDLISEDSATLPETLYAYSKLFGERLIIEWAKNNNVIPQILRVGHIYGEGEEKYKKVLPNTIKKVIRNEAPIIFSHGKEKRTFLYVKDCCEFILKSMELTEYIGPINLVGSSSITILDLVNLIIKISGNNILPIIENNNLVTRDYTFNNTKMIQHFGKEKTTLEDGLLSEIEYFKKKL